ncbi:50S ribosomal protein L30 [Thermoplasmatales archaeon SW_10_69_26]|jgi:large subunit ribosomal protein L30|nr:MAG: 50S ribosomal protein L30 [Thermoplasmatales archaeon SW_10_69_26]
MSYAVIRLRGQTKLRHDQKKTLESLRLLKVNHATIVPETDEYEGMLNRVEHFVTYGELTPETAEELLAERGRIRGGDPLTDDHVDEETEHGNLSDLAEALAEGEADVAHLDSIKPVFRLAPARGGLTNTKRHVNEGGSLGYRGQEIGDLIERML